MVIQASGFQAEPVSSYAVQYAINGYSNPADAQGFVYTDLGHTFYVLSFLADDITWCLDVDLGRTGWHERATWISEENMFVAWRPRWYARAFGEHRTLDAGGGNIYRVGSDLTTDVDSREIRRLRRAPAVSNENKRVFYKQFEVELERGIGTVTGQGSDPLVMMRFSNDYGRTWSNEKTATAGKIGEYNTRVHWHRLGVGRGRVFEISMTDPIPWKITKASLELEPGEE